MGYVHENQYRRVVRLAMRPQGVTTIEAARYGIARLGARIHELEQKRWIRFNRTEQRRPGTAHEWPVVYLVYRLATNRAQALADTEPRKTRRTTS